MTTQEQYIERLKELVTAELGRPILTTDDCIALSNAVLESVGISIEHESLEQLFIAEGYAAPRPLMLSSLARFVGYTGWSDFCTAGDITPSEDKDALPIVRRWGVIGLTAIAVIIVVISIVALVNSGNSGGDDESVDSRFRNVEQLWLSRTEERCNTLRTYYNEREAHRYNQRVDKFIDRYEILLEKKVKNDIKDYAIQNKITVDNDTIDKTAEIIIESCLEMCENIKID